MGSNFDMLVVFAVLAIAVLVGLWNNWIFIGPDGYNLTGKDRPSLLRFYTALLLHPVKTFEGSIFWPVPPQE